MAAPAPQKRSPRVHRGPELINGGYLFSLKARTLGDIRALGGNDAEDELRFATVRAVSEANLGLYRTFASPIIKNFVTEQSAGERQQSYPFGLPA